MHRVFVIIRGGSAGAEGVSKGHCQRYTMYGLVQGGEGGGGGYDYQRWECWHRRSRKGSLSEVYYVWISVGRLVTRGRGAGASGVGYRECRVLHGGQSKVNTIS